MPLYKERGTPRPAALPPSTSWQQGRWPQIRRLGATVGAGDVILQHGTGGGTHKRGALCNGGSVGSSSCLASRVPRWDAGSDSGIPSAGSTRAFYLPTKQAKPPPRLPAARFRSSVSSGSLVLLRRPLLESGRGRKRGLEGVRPSRWLMESRGSPLPPFPIGLLCS